MERDQCPNCGADLPPSARACPECGSDETTGWSERAVRDRLDLPDEDFDYGSFLREEFGEDESPVKPRQNRHWVWWVAAVLLLAVLAAVWLHWW